MLDKIRALIDYYIFGTAFKCDNCKRITYGGFGSGRPGHRGFLCSEHCIKEYNRKKLSRTNI